MSGPTIRDAPLTRILLAGLGLTNALAAWREPLSAVHYIVEASGRIGWATVALLAACAAVLLADAVLNRLHRWPRRRWLAVAGRWAGVGQLFALLSIAYSAAVHDVGGVLPFYLLVAGVLAAALWLDADRGRCDAD